jgi:metal-responsive CopG/Arc/MetJ family transcriptional regulator
MSRVTISIHNKLDGELKKFAKSQKKSVSRITVAAIEHYLNVMKRRQLGKKALDLVGKENVSPNAIKELEAGRIDCDSRL